MTRIGQLLEEFRDSQAFPPSNRAIARSLGVSATTLARWVQGDAVPGFLPTPTSIANLADLLGKPYREVFEAAATDAGYLPAPTTSEGVVE